MTFITKRLTKSEALAQGYTMYGVDSHDFQHMNMIADMNEEDFKHAYGKLLVCDKKEYTCSISPEELLDIISSHVVDNNEFKDDTDEIPDLLKKEINWPEIAERINIVLQKRTYYYLTTIELVSDNEDTSEVPMSPGITDSETGLI